jgi:hypothetical protein
MLESLVDHPVPIYVVLGLLALGLLVGLWATRKRGYALGLGVVAVLAFLFWLFTFLMPTDQKRIVGAIQDMRAGVQKRNTEQIFRNMSRDFRIGGLGRAAFRTVVEQALNRSEVDDVEVWDFDQAQVARAPGGTTGTASIGFMVKPKSSGLPDDRFFRVQADFVLEDGQWRMKGFEVRDPVANQPVPIPHVP